MLFNDLCQALEGIRVERGRLNKESLFEDFLERVNDDDVRKAILWLVDGKLRPNYEGVFLKDLNLNMDLEFVENPLTIVEVYTNLMAIARDTSGISKQESFDRMTERCSDLERTYLDDQIKQAKRLGFAEAGICNALGKLAARRSQLISVQDAKNAVRQAFNECSDYSKIVESIREHGIEQLTEIIQVSAGTPTRPMLCTILKNNAEVCKQITGGSDPIVCEPIINGYRVQVTCGQNKKVRIFDRNQFELTQGYPNIVRVMSDFLDSKPPMNFVLDGELELRNTKERKYDSPKRSTSGQLQPGYQAPTFHVFDILMSGGVRVWDRPLHERRKLLLDQFEEGFVNNDDLTIVKNDTVTDMQQLLAFYNQAVEEGHGGLILKKVNSQYELNKRPKSWQKLKFVPVQANPKAVKVKTKTKTEADK